MRQRSNLIILFGIAFFIVGGAIVFLVLNDDDDGGGSRGGSAGAAQVAVLVAAQDIEAGTLGSDVIEQGLLRSEQVAAGTQPVGAIGNADLLVNKIFTTAVNEGDIIVDGQTGTRSLSNVQIPEGFDGLAVDVAYTPGGAGYIAPGDTVNLFGVFDGDDDEGLANTAPGFEDPSFLPRAEMILTNVLVLDVSAQQTTSSQAAQAESSEAINRPRQTGGLTYLLALRPTDAERIVALTSFANIYLSLTADGAPNVPDTPGYSGQNILEPVGADSAQPQS